MVCVCVCVRLPGYFSVILMSLYCLYKGLDVSTSQPMASYRRSWSSNPLLTLKHINHILKYLTHTHTHTHCPAVESVLSTTLHSKF